MSYTFMYEEVDRIGVSYAPIIKGYTQHPTDISYQNPMRIPLDFTELNKGKDRKYKNYGRRAFLNPKFLKEHLRRVAWYKYCATREIPLFSEVPKSFCTYLIVKITPLVFKKRRKIG